MWMYTITGACDANKVLDGLTFLNEGHTLSGAPYYKAIGYEYYIYHDPDCTKSGDGAASWLIDMHRPNTNVPYGLDGDGHCDFIARISSKTISNPPTRGTWQMNCGGVTKKQYLLFYEYTTTAGPCKEGATSEKTTHDPNEEHTTGEATTTEGDTTTEVSGIAPCPESESTTDVPSTTEEVVAMPNLVLTGACEQNAALNGLLFSYSGRTADGSPYYKAQDTEEYIYFDSDCDGEEGDSNVARWVLDDSAPSTTSMSDLDEDQECNYLARFDAPSSSGGPPSSGTWDMYCATCGWVKVQLTLAEDLSQADDVLIAAARGVPSAGVSICLLILAQLIRSFA